MVDGSCSFRITSHALAFRWNCTVGCRLAHGLIKCVREGGILFTCLTAFVLFLVCLHYILLSRILVLLPPNFLLYYFQYVYAIFHYQARIKGQKYIQQFSQLYYCLADSACCTIGRHGNSLTHIIRSTFFVFHTSINHDKRSLIAGNLSMFLCIGL